LRFLKSTSFTATYGLKAMCPKTPGKDDKNKNDKKECLP
jgi:hypothetical protein